MRAEHISYQLRIAVRRRVRLAIGALGKLEFPAGIYVYTGSARRNLAARVTRHLSRAKRLHWHIDFLLHSPAARVQGVLLSAAPECELNRGTRGEVVARRFGASDCRSGCGSHLKLVSRT